MPKLSETRKLYEERISPFLTLLSKAFFLRVIKTHYMYYLIKRLTLYRIIQSLTFSQTSPGFYVSAVQVFRKHCGKRRNCSLPAISPFPTVFSTLSDNFSPLSPKLKLSANSFNLEASKICRLGKG